MAREDKPDNPATRRFGRFTEPAIWILMALRDGPRSVPMLFDHIRSLDGPIGHGTLFAAVARLERLDLVEPTSDEGRHPAYRLTRLGANAAASASALQSEARS